MDTTNKWLIELAEQEEVYIDEDITLKELRK